MVDSTPASVSGPVTEKANDRLSQRYTVAYREKTWKFWLIPEFEHYDGRWALLIEELEIDWRSEYPFESAEQALQEALNILGTETQQVIIAKTSRQKKSQIGRTGFWLFQCNPRQYDLVKDIAASAVGDEDAWSVSRYKYEMRPEDKVVFWMSGKRAGAYALGVLRSEPYRRYWEPPEGPRYLQADWWVDFKYTAFLNPPVLRAEVKENSILTNMMVIRAPTGTNFPMTSDEWEMLQSLARKSSRP